MLKPAALISVWFLGLLGGVATAQNGNLDPTFIPPLLANSTGAVRVMAISETGGKFLVAGDFDSADGQAVGRLLKLMPDGSVDPTFVPGSGANGAIRCMILVSNQKILIGGDFTDYNGTPRGRIARLNSDGTLDSGFNPGSGFDGPVHSLQTQFQNSSNYFAGGSFADYNGTPRANVALMNSTGGVSPSFVSGTNGPVYALLSASFLPDNSSLLVGGDFNIAGGAVRKSLAGLLGNGSVTIFNSGPGLGPNGIVRSIVPIDSGGPIWIGGTFSHYSGWPRQNLALLDRFSNTTGGVSDYLNFSPLVSVDSTVYAMTLRDSFSMLMGGSFSKLNATPKNRFAAVRNLGFSSTSSWGVDANYHNGSGADGDVLALRRTTDGKMVIGGEFQTVNGIARLGIARLLGTASLSPPSVPANLVVEGVSNSEILAVWNAVTNATGYLVESSPNSATDWTTLADVSTNRALITGLAAGTIRHIRVRAYNSNGNGESSASRSTFTAATPWTGAGRPDPAIPLVNEPTLDACTLTPDGRIIVAGAYSRSNLPSTVVRYFPNGTLDLSFNIGSIGIGTGYKLAVDRSGRVYVGGFFTSVAGVPRDSLVRLMPNGGLDLSFNHGTGSTDEPADLGVQYSGKLIVAGSETLAGRTTGDLIRLNTDGSLDSTFGAFVDRLSGMRVLSDDRILIWGSSLMVNGQAAQEVALLTADGQFDPSFTPVDISGTIHDALSLPGGKWLVAGTVTAVGGTSVNGIARLLGNGALDPTFSLPATPDQSVSSAVVQPDGKIVFAGSFSAIGNRIFRGIARVLPDGAIDDDFRPGSGFFPTSVPGKIVQLPDLRICAVGSFDTYAGVPHKSLAYITGDAPPSHPPAANLLTAQPTADAGTHLAWTAVTTGFDYLIQSSADGLSGWQTVRTADFVTLAAVMPYSSTAVPVFYRVVARNHAGETAGNVVPAVSNDAFLTWRIREGVGADKQSQSDDDEDGAPLLLEYAFGMNPVLPDTDGLPVVAMAGGVLTILFEEVRSDVEYEVETSTDLSEWTTEGVGVFRSSWSLGWVPAGSERQRYLRVRVSR